MAGPLDWLQQILGGAVPPSSIDQLPSDTGPVALRLLQDVVSGRAAASGSMGQNYYDPSHSFAQNALDPRAIQQAIDMLQPGAIRPMPLRAADLANINSKVDLGTLYRGVGSEYAGNLRTSEGDIGKAVYLTPEEWLANTYGGGPDASVAKGTRIVDSYKAQPLFPDDVAYVFGGAKYGEDASLVSGNGIEFWRGKYSPQAIEAALAEQGPGIKAVIGTPDSIGLNQVGVRDPSILTQIRKLLGAEGP